MKKFMATSLVATLLLTGSVSTAFAKEGNHQDEENGHKQKHAAKYMAPAPQAASAKFTVSAPAPQTAPAAAAGTKADKLISFAESLQGKVQYGYAKRVTTNPNHLLLDCSSFTQYVYKQALGQYIPWGSNAQHNSSPHVAKADLQKGDLVYFSVGSRSTIGHVGIYIGGGKFIHNVNPKSNVVISDLSSGYWQRHYIDASRPLK